MSRKLSKTTILSTILLSISSTVIIFSGSMLLTAEAVLEFDTNVPGYIGLSSGGKAIGTPIMFTIQGAIPAAGTTGATISVDTTPPKVVSVTPRNGATGIQFSSPITATFSEILLGNSITPNTFYVEDLSTHSRIPGSVILSADGKSVKFQPITPMPAAWFIVVITPDIRDITGNFMTAPVVWAFSTLAATGGATQQPGGGPTDTIQPKVVSFSPTNGATDVPLLSTITATFSEQVRASSLSASTFQVRDGGGASVSGSLTPGPAGHPNVFVFKSSSQLASSKKYSVTITTGVKDLAGNALASATKWSFTTGTQASADTSAPPTGTSGDITHLKVVSIRPSDGETGVTIASSILVTFSKAVLPSSVTTTFDVVTTGPGGGVGPIKIPSIVHVPGIVTLSTDGKTVTFHPIEPFGVSKTYSYSITGPKDLAGNSLTPNPNIGGSFTTGSP